MDVLLVRIPKLKILEVPGKKNDLAGKLAGTNSGTKTVIFRKQSVIVWIKRSFWGKIGHFGVKKATWAVISYLITTKLPPSQKS